MLKAIRDEDETYGTTFEGAVGKLFDHKGKLYYTIQWATCEPIDDYVIEDEEEEVIEIDGETITREDWELYFEGEICAWCRTPLEFINGHEKLKKSTCYVCADCIAEDSHLPNNVISNDDESQSCC